MRRFIRIVTLAVGALCKVGNLESQDSRPEQIHGNLRWRFLGPGFYGGKSSEIVAALPGAQDAWVPGTRLLLALATGGVWRTMDGGSTWQSVFDNQPTLAVSTLALSKADPGLVWAGTGDLHAAGIVNAATRGSGVYRSDDFGTTWTPVGFDSSFMIGRIAAHPTDAGTAYVGWAAI